MFRLIESNPQKHRTLTETGVSIAIHTVLIAALVYATARSGEVMMAPTGKFESITYTVPKAPAPAAPAAAAPRRQPPAQPSRQRALTPPAPVQEAGASELSDPSATGLATGDSPGERDAYYDYEVGVAASTLGGLRPRYPDNLRQAGIEGRVVIEFVVDERGRVDTRTVKVIESTHAQFLNAVRNALGGMRFSPARVNGVAVRQYVRLPVTFKIES